MYEGTKVPHVLRDHDTGAALLELEQSWSWLVVGEGGALAVTPGQERSPATGVTWDGARLYCASRGKRLPTDAEWEYAARGRTHRRYPWGDAPPACDGAIFGRVKDLACAALPHGPGDVGAATQDRTAEGVHDLFGNASEWVEDAYVAPYLPGCGACKDPVVAPTGREADDERVVRGNSWMVSLFGMTSARTRWRRGGSTAGIGFRCAASTR
jgi:formylglycine-generating enzyme required for sulfatase activity